MNDERPAHERDPHRWALARVASWRAGLLDEREADRVVEHIRICETCRELEGLEVGSESDLGRHLPASLVAQWPRAQVTLRGLERVLMRRHLERCPECRQDLELLGYEPKLDDVAAGAPEARREIAAPEALGAIEVTARPRATVRIVRGDPGERGWRFRERCLLAWGSLATVAAAIAIVVLVRRPVVEGVPSVLFSLSPPPATIADAGHGGPWVRLAPRPRSLSGPARGPRGGKVTVIPVIGPVPSLALAVRPLSVPDTSWVQVSLVRGDGDTLLTVRHRQWEFFPKRMLVIDGGNAPLEPGRYALVLASLMSSESPTGQMSRYLFELRPRTH